MRSTRPVHISTPKPLPSPSVSSHNGRRSGRARGWFIVQWTHPHHPSTAKGMRARECAKRVTDAGSKSPRYLPLSAPSLLQSLINPIPSVMVRSPAADAVTTTRFACSGDGSEPKIVCFQRGRFFLGSFFSKSVD